MNYTKPEVAVLGKAVRVIEHKTGKGVLTVYDGGLKNTGNAAYDLDE